MAIETVQFINDFNQTYPAETEGIADGDDHLRNLKKALLNTFPGRTRPEGAYVLLAGASVSLDTTMLGCFVDATQATSVTLPKLGSNFAGYVYWFTPTQSGTMAGTGGDTLNGGASFSYKAGVTYRISGTSSTTWKIGWTQEFASGTRLIFAQASAPVGWTQVTTDDADNRMIRVVNTATHATGGSHSPILNNVVPAHTHGFTTGNESADHTHSGSTGYISHDHSHAVYDPGHAHSFSMWVPQGTVNAGGERVGDMIVGGSGTNAAGTGIYLGGVNTNHFHSFTSGGRSAAHTHSGSTDNGSSQTNWTPRYLDNILCAKA